MRGRPLGTFGKNTTTARVLTYLREHDGWWMPRAFAWRVPCSEATARRLLRRLADRGLVESRIVMCRSRWRNEWRAT